MAINLNDAAPNRIRAPVITILGGPGIGKTTFACGAPDAIVLRVEDGLGSLKVKTLPLFHSYDDLMGVLVQLRDDDHGYRSIVIDSLDWLEPLIWQKVCNVQGLKSIEDKGWGKGYVDALTYWREIFGVIRQIGEMRGVLTVATLHTKLIRVEDPTLPAYHMVGMKLQERASSVVEESCDVILHARESTVTVSEKLGDKQRTRAVGTGDRVIHTVGCPAFLAKSRYPMPAVLPLQWEAFWDALCACMSA